MEGYIFLFLYGPYISNYYSVIYFFKWFNYLDYSCSFGYLLSKSTQFCSLNWLIKLLVSYVIKVFYVHVNRQVRSGLPLFPSPPLPPPPLPPTHTHLTSKFSTLIYLNETLFWTLANELRVLLLQYYLPCLLNLSNIDHIVTICA